MSGFVDIHSHFVYGVDDGAQTQKEMYAMLDQAYAEGITSLCATSHVVPGIRSFDTESYELHLSEARAYCEHKGYALTIYSGAEILYTPQIAYYMDSHALPTIAGSQVVLVEFSPSIAGQELEFAVKTIGSRGYQVTVAHAERYDCLLKGNMLEKLKQEYHPLIQVNAETIVKQQPFFRGRTIHKWFQERLIDYVASDAHNTEHRRFRTHEAHEVLIQRYGQAYADHLMGCE